MSFFNELKRRNVLRVAAAYLAGAWLLIEVSETLFSIYGLPDTAAQIVATLLIIGFPVTLVLSWVYELTPEGLKKEKDLDRVGPSPRSDTRRLDRIIIVLLALALGYFAFDKFVLEPARVTELVEETAQQARSEALVESYGDKSIAVLPFVNMSADPEQEYFSDGITEELLNLLARIPQVRVPARTSSFYFKGKDTTIRDVAEELQVAHILEGSVRKAGGQVRITAQLIEARSDTHLWSETYDRDLENIFAIQEEISAAIIDALRERLGLTVGAAPQVIAAASIDAYDVYLEGRKLVHQRDGDSLAKAIRHFERALRLDANFAPAHAQLATAAILEVQVRSRLLEDAKLVAAPHIERALELEPELYEAHGASALLALLEHDPETAISHAEWALALNPSYSDALTAMANALERLGRYEESFEVFRQVLDVDPLNIIGLRNYAGKLNDRGRTAEAHELADRLITVSPVWAYDLHTVTSLLYEGKIAEALYWALKQDREAGRPIGYATHALSFVGEHDESRRMGAVALPAEEDRVETAIESAQRALRRDPDNIGRLSLAAILLAGEGRFDDALPLLERALDLSPDGRPIAWRLGLVATMDLAEGRRRFGDEAGAEAAAALARDDYAAQVAAGLKNENLDFWGALIAAFDRDYDAAIERLRSSIRRGMRDKMIFGAYQFDDLRGDPRFIAVQQELDEILEEEHEKVLQLICFNNPVPDDWRPLPDTCEDVEERTP